MDKVFTIFHNEQQVWKVMLDNIVLPTEWNSKGAAEIGLVVERYRKNKRLVVERCRKNKRIEKQQENKHCY